MITVRRIAPDDGPLLRQVRLAAIADSPGTFLTTVQQAESRTDDQWAAAAAANAGGASQATFFAEVDGRVVGMIGAYIMADGVATLVGLWSAPGHRAMGVADALVSAVSDWATRSGALQLRQWVVGRNAHALKFYADHGFTATGATMPYETDPALDQVELVRPLVPG